MLVAAGLIFTAAISPPALGNQVSEEVRKVLGHVVGTADEPGDRQAVFTGWEQAAKDNPYRRVRFVSLSVRDTADLTKPAIIESSAFMVIQDVWGTTEAIDKAQKAANEAQVRTTKWYDYVGQYSLKVHVNFDPASGLTANLTVGSNPDMSITVSGDDIGRLKECIKESGQWIAATPPTPPNPFDPYKIAVERAKRWQHIDHWRHYGTGIFDDIDNQWVVVTAQDCWIYRRPSLGSTKVSPLKMGRTFSVYVFNSHWLKIPLGTVRSPFSATKFGYIPKSYLKPKQF